jgi:DNA-binding LacI/PurR family transcriptional regulator
LRPKKRFGGANITIKDVAQHARVSIGTVSNVLNGTTPVKDGLRQRVLEAIRQLGYQPNELARGFRRNRTNLLGMVIPDILNPFFPAIVRGAQDGAYQKSFNLVLCNSDNDQGKEAQYLQELRDHRIAGILLTPSGSTWMDLLPQKSLAQIPIICIDRRPIHWSGDSVTGDNRQGAFLATQYLLELGHRAIALIGGSPDLSNAIDRKEGFRAAMRERHIPIAPGYIQDGDFNRISGYDKMRTLLQLRPRPTAVLAGNDLIAYGALKAIREAGLECPMDISIVGFDDLESSEYTDPALTTVAQPAYQMGASGADLLLNRIAGGRGAPVHLVLPTELKLRHSVKAPPKKKAGRM